jgi:hypothetical protein
MKQFNQRAFGIVVGVLAATAATAALAAGSPHHTPTLTLTHRSPATVVGRHFAPRKNVRVTVTSSATETRRVLTNAKGTFTVTFTTMVDRCSSWSVVARQPGRAPVVIHGAKPACAPMGTP